MLSAHAIGAGGLGFDSRAGQIGIVSPALRRFFGAMYCVVQALSYGDGPRYTLRRNTASNMMIDDMIFFDFVIFLVNCIHLETNTIY